MDAIQQALHINEIHFASVPIKNVTFEQIWLFSFG
jgi:hypothetical protein